MNPLICYICFNRMGSTVLGLQSLLRTKDDFDLYIGDNDSRDKTWDFLMSLKDSRIREIKKFENYGELNVANWAISKRRRCQDFIIMENDCEIHQDTFVSQFDRAFEEIPKLGAISGWLRSIPIDKNTLYGYFYPSPLMGIFTCTKGEAMDGLGYYSEACCAADQEWNYRLMLLGYCTGYITTIDCSVIHPWASYNCEDCRKRQSVCRSEDKLVIIKGEERPFDLARELYCNRYYPMLNRSFHKTHGAEAVGLAGSLIIETKQIYWDSIHSGNPISDWQEANRKKFQGFFKERYEKYLKDNNLV